MPEQDFSKKISICVRKDLPEWQVLNTVAHISAYFGNLLGENFSTPGDFITKDQEHFSKNTQYGIVVLRASEKDVKKVLAKAKAEKVEWNAFTRQMIDMIDDNEIQADFTTKNFEDIELLGVGLFGDRDTVQTLTKGLQVWR